MSSESKLESKPSSFVEEIDVTCPITRQIFFKPVATKCTHPHIFEEDVLLELTMPRPIIEEEESEEEEPMEDESAPPEIKQSTADNLPPLEENSEPLEEQSIENQPASSETKQSTADSLPPLEEDLEPLEEQSMEDQPEPLETKHEGPRCPLCREAIPDRNFSFAKEKFQQVTSYLEANPDALQDQYFSDSLLFSVIHLSPADPIYPHLINKIVKNPDLLNKHYVDGFTLLNTILLTQPDGFALLAREPELRNAITTEGWGMVITKEGDYNEGAFPFLIAASSLDLIDLLRSCWGLRNTITKEMLAKRVLTARLQGISPLFNLCGNAKGIKLLTADNNRLLDMATTEELQAPILSAPYTGLTPFINLSMRPEGTSLIKNNIRLRHKITTSALAQFATSDDQHQRYSLFLNLLNVENDIILDSFFVDKHLINQITLPLLQITLDSNRPRDGDFHVGSKETRPLLSLLLQDPNGPVFLQLLDPQLLDAFLETEFPAVWKAGEDQENVEKTKAHIVERLDSFAGGKRYINKHPFLLQYLLMIPSKPIKEEEEEKESKHGSAAKRKREEDNESEQGVSVEEYSHYLRSGVSADILANSMMPAISSPPPKSTFMEFDCSSVSNQGEHSPYSRLGVFSSTLASSRMPALAPSSPPPTIESTFMDMDFGCSFEDTLPLQGSEHSTSHKKPKTEESSSSSSSSIEPPRTSRGPSHN